MALGGGNSGGSASGIKAGSAYVTLGLKNFLPQDLLKAQQSFGKFGDAIGKMGRAMALGGAAALTPLVGAMSTLNDVAKQGSIANALGLTSEQFTGMAGAAKAVGNNTREFIESLVTLGKLGTDAVGNIGTVAAPAFKTLGLNAEEFIKLRTDEQFFQMFAAIKKVEDPLARVRMLMLAFGEDGGKLLLPLLDKSNEELRKFAAGFAVSSDDMVKAQQAALSYTAATSALGKAWRSVSIAAAPIVKAIADGFAQAAGPLSGFINANREIVVGLGLAAGGITAVGVGLMVLGPAIKALTASWGLFTGAVVAGKAVIAGTFAVLASPILVLPAALAGAGAAWLAFTTQGNATVKRFADGVKEAFGPTFENLTRGWKMVVGAVQAGDFEKAFRVAGLTLNAEWVRITNGLGNQWAKMVDGMVLKFDIIQKGIGKQFGAVGGAVGEGAGIVQPGGAGAQPEGLNKRGQFAAGMMGMHIWNVEQVLGAFWDRRGKDIKAKAEEVAKDMIAVAEPGAQLNMMRDAWRQIHAGRRQREADQPLKDLIQAGILGDFIKGQWAGVMGGANWLQGGWNDAKKLLGGDVGRQIADISTRTMGTFGGSANAGMFGQGGGALDELKKGNKLAEKNNEKLDIIAGKMGMGGGLLVQAGG